VRRLVLALFVFALVAHIGTRAAQVSDAKRPNVVLIITDDAGYGDFGSYGAPDIKTPHIDSLARDGVRLTDFYANGSTCTPTRAALITGRYQQRVGLELVLTPADTDLGLPASGRSLPQLLKNNGFATALVGKWHLGWKPEFSPAAHGFDYFFGFKAGGTDYYKHANREGEPDLFENDRLVDVPGYMTDLITDRSVRFIEQNRVRPFFIEVAYNAPHWPYQRPDVPSTVPGNAWDPGILNDRTTRADYAAILERADDGIGRILEALNRLNLSRNTVVIFTNDNGGESLSRNAPLFHYKGTLWEGGIRVPAIVRWPGRIPSGRVSGQVGMTMDLTASILAATNTPVPPEARLDGIDLFPVLEGRVPEIERTLFWRETLGQSAAVRSGDWKLLNDGKRNMLFNVRKDLGERDDLIAQHREIAGRLLALRREWQIKVNPEVQRPK
jgi:arylsulfatase A-like enzyme